MRYAIIYVLILFHVIYGETTELNINDELLSACEMSNFEEVKRLINAGANVNYQPINGNTPLIVTLINPSPSRDIINYLINKGAKINYNDGEISPLMIAANIGYIDIVNTLINKGVNINTKDNFGNNALLIACDGSVPKYQNGYIDIVKTLIKAGSEVNLVSTQFNRDGYTPLLLASKNGYDKILIELIKAGADINAKNKEGKNALIIAIENSVYSENRREYDYIETIRIIISKLGNINEKDNDDNTALSIINNKIESGYGYEDDQELYSNIRKILVNAGAK